ncbi:amino acid ABC transporter permease [Serinibacter arcticus]|uniref:Polar amino acid ABC transporter, inner membrane subunit n=1 Tax=Serinibacter arcticus TaxID=1655435 RepID=A0A4Z1E1J7_9MICO|nr:amino acid ABC transporter permease [Serinibacter arcticus]TGO05825.1 polar amino acid ABC transporter, inner membrane subunit [Serinibacter arcticus]
MDLDLVRESIGPLLSGTIRGTIPLTAASFVGGMVLAVLVALARLSRVGVVRWIAQGYVSIIRGTPLLVQLFIIFYALPSLGLTIDPFPSAIIAFSLNVGGYASEIVRAAILSIPRGQWEAAETIGYSRTMALRRVILPQAARVAVPPLSNTFISLVKDTSLASTILVTELLRKAQEIAAPTFEFLTLYSLAAVIYWVLCLVLSIGQGFLERRLGRHLQPQIAKVEKVRQATA